MQPKGAGNENKIIQKFRPNRWNARNACEMLDVELLTMNRVTIDQIPHQYCDDVTTTIWIAFNIACIRVPFNDKSDLFGFFFWYKIKWGWGFEDAICATCKIHWSCPSLPHVPTLFQRPAMNMVKICKYESQSQVHLEYPLSVEEII